MCKIRENVLASSMLIAQKKKKKKKQKQKNKTKQTFRHQTMIVFDPAMISFQPN